MKYAGLIKNDFSAAPGVSVTFFTQGCPHCCKGCHNPETWDFNGGKEFTPKSFKEILDALLANGFTRNLCIMGGEPLCPENSYFVYNLIVAIKDYIPDLKIYLWTGYYLDELRNNWSDPMVGPILSLIDVLIDGPYMEELRDVTLFMRGSSNQNIYYLKENENGNA